MKFKKIINSLTDKQIRLARLIEKYGLASFTKACEALYKKDKVVNYWIEFIRKQKNN